jgi:polyisoprenoid-binding protein YceI
MSALAQPQVATSTWNIDPVHSVAEFKVKHMMISHVKGQFTRVSGVLTRDEADHTKSRVEATIDVASITTRDPQRDAHLQSADFFDVAKYPTISFRSTSIVRKGKDQLAVEGDLTIHGVTRRVTLAVDGPTPEAKDPWGNTRIGLSAEVKVNRKDYGLAWNTPLETGGFLVGDDIAITLEVQFVKA